MITGKLIFFFLSVAGSVGFVQILRWAQRRGCDVYSVAAINYFFASIFFLCWILLFKIDIDHEVVLGGALCGVIFGTTFFVLLYCMNSMGVGKTATTMNLSQSIPILMSILIWQERPGVMTVAGILLAGLAIPLILLPKMRHEKGVSLPGVLGLMVLFITQGVVYTFFKWFERLGRPEEKPVMLLSLFGVAFLITLLIVLLKKSHFSKVDLSFGLAIGGCNMIGPAAVLVVLTLAPANIALSTITALVVVCNTLLSIWLWKERFSLKTYFGMVLAIIAVFLINL